MKSFGLKIRQKLSGKYKVTFGIFFLLLIFSLSDLFNMIRKYKKIKNQIWDVERNYLMFTKSDSVHVLGHYVRVVPGPNREEGRAEGKCWLNWSPPSGCSPPLPS